MQSRFDSKVARDPAGHCWVWTASRSPEGYGRFWLNGQNLYAHRVSYGLWVGPIPEGLTLDHLCRNRACVNPDHLEPVSIAENIERGEAGAKKRNATHCVQGHPLSGENLYVKPNGFRVCRTCARAATRRYEQRSRERLESEP
jgi:hypothetical protein